MFPDDTNLFCMNKNIKTLLDTANNGMLMTGWKKTNFLLMQEKQIYKQWPCDSIPLRLPILKFNNVEIKKRPQWNFLE